MLLDVRVHDRPEVEILDVSEQVDDEHLVEIPGFTGGLSPTPSTKQALSSSRNGKPSVFYLVLPVGGEHVLSILSLNCSVCSVLAFPGLPIQTWLHCLPVLLRASSQ